VPSERNDSFVRWQGRTIEQLGFVNNLLIGLAAGILAFQMDKGLSFNPQDKAMKGMGVAGDGSESKPRPVPDSIPDLAPRE
jgi:hypothetical protein